MHSAKDASHWRQIWQVLGPWISPCGTTIGLTKYGTSNGKIPSSDFRCMGFGMSVLPTRTDARTHSRSSTLRLQPEKLRCKKQSHKLWGGAAIPMSNITNIYMVWNYEMCMNQKTLYKTNLFPTSKLFNEHLTTAILQRWTRWTMSNAKPGSASKYQRHFIAADAKQVHLVWWLRFIWSHSMKLIIRYNQYLHPVI